MPIVDFTRQTLTRIAQISIGPPPPPPAPPLHPLCHRTPHTTSCYRRWLVGRIGDGFSLLFLPLRFAGSGHGDDRGKDPSNTFRSVPRRVGCWSRTGHHHPWQAGLGIETRASRGEPWKPRDSPLVRLLALRKSAINQITPPQKGETWAGAGSPVSRLPSAPVRLPESRRCHGQLAIVSSLTLHDVQNGDGPAQPFGPAHHMAMARWRPTGPSP